MSYAFFAEFLLHVIDQSVYVVFLFCGSRHSPGTVPADIGGRGMIHYGISVSQDFIAVGSDFFTLPRDRDSHGSGGADFFRNRRNRNFAVYLSGKRSRAVVISRKNRVNAVGNITNLGRAVLRAVLIPYIRRQGDGRSFLRYGVLRCVEGKLLNNAGTGLLFKLRNPVCKINVINSS